MRGFVRRAAREVRGAREMRGRDVSLPAVTTKAPGSKDRGARVCVSSCYAIHRRLMEQLSRAIPVLLEDWSLVPLS